MPKKSMRAQLEEQQREIAENKRQLQLMLDKVPPVPPGGGLLGAAINLLATQGDTLVDASTAAFTKEQEINLALAIMDRHTPAESRNEVRELLIPRGGKEAQPGMKPRKKRKVSDYSKQFGIILKSLKKKHPRTPVTKLMAKAHTKTRKEMKLPASERTKLPPKKKGRLSKGRRTIAKSGQFRRDKILPRKR